MVEHGRVVSKCSSQPTFGAVQGFAALCKAGQPGHCPASPEMHAAGPGCVPKAEVHALKTN